MKETLHPYVIVNLADVPLRSAVLDGPQPYMTIPDSAIQEITRQQTKGVHPDPVLIRPVITLRKMKAVRVDLALEVTIIPKKTDRHVDLDPVHLQLSTRTGEGLGEGLGLL